MRVLVLLASVGCCGGTIAPVAAPSRSRLGTSEVARYADQALHRERAMNYARPMAGMSRARPESAFWFHELCVRGDHAACRTEAWIRDPDREGDGSAFDVVADECRAGDMMSCRALPPDDVLGRGYRDLPGAMSRRLDCRYWPGPSCDATALRAECAAGFPYACSEAAHTVLRPASATWTGLGVFFFTEACMAGVPDACRESRAHRNDQAWLEHTCLYNDECDRGLEDSLEHECQYRGIPVACASLAREYRREDSDEYVDQPVWWRARQLEDWACPQLPPDERSTCEEWEARQREREALQEIVDHLSGNAGR